MNKLKIINDPIYGFVTISSALIFDIIEHPYFQRLRRVSQMGMSNIVYPGAHHTRFQHAIGCTHLMQKTVQVLRFKGIDISNKEEEALYIAILLHDIGHGAFSHVLEHSIVSGISHEEISLKYMKVLNNEFNGKLSLAIDIFQGNHPRSFFNQLISSQLDIDRLDYLKRDSFYTGVAEGNVNSEHLITMMNVKNGNLVVEKKGIYSVEKFIIARRLMYWQVYLHKTSLITEKILVQILKRAKELTKQNMNLGVSKALNFFLSNNIHKIDFDKEVLGVFSQLDDYDIISALKLWQDHDDFVLSTLSKSIIQRKLPKIKLTKEKVSKGEIQQVKNEVKEKFAISENEIDYFVLKGKVSNHAYSIDESPIHIMLKDGNLIDIVTATDHLNLMALTKPVVKYYISHPK